VLYRQGTGPLGCTHVHLAQIAGVFRSAVNRSTGFTANKLMLGRKVNTPAHLMYPPPPRAEEPDLDTYLADLQKSMLLAHETSRSQRRTTEKRDYDLKVRSHTCEVGDFVYLLDHRQGEVPEIEPLVEGLWSHRPKAHRPSIQSPHP
jgi:hypothetical protein